MASSDKDTDPSTPRAIRPADGFTALAETPSPAKLRPSTDPGLGPPPDLRPLSPPPPRGRAMGIVVPSPTPSLVSTLPTPPSAIPVQDSIELLLEGMAGPLLDRTKTTPQSDGEAAAAYHAQHGLRPARPAGLGEPKVLVERWPFSSFRRPTRDPLAATVPGPIRSNDLARRTVLAALAGLLVVALLFVVFRWSARSGSTERDLSRAATMAPEMPVAAAGPAAPAVPTGASAAGEGLLPLEPTVAATVASVGSADNTPAKPRPRAPRSATSAAGLGEFTTKF